MNRNNLIKILGVSVLLLIYFLAVLWVLDPFLVHEKGGVSLTYFYSLIGVYSLFASVYVLLINNWLNQLKIDVFKRYLLKLTNTLVGILILVVLLHFSLKDLDILFNSFSNISFVVLLSSLLPVAIGIIKERDRIEFNTDFIDGEEQDNLVPLDIPWYNGKQITSFNERDVICLESSDNYVKVYFLKDNQLNKEVIRTTLKKVESNLSENSQVVRVHKSYLINPAHIEKITGVSQAYKLRMSLVEEKIPVSRSFDIELLKE